MDPFQSDQFDGTLAESAFDVTFTDGQKGQWARKVMDESLTARSITNLSSIFISLLRRQFGPDEALGQFIDHLWAFALSEQHSRLFSKHSQSVRDNLLRIKTGLSIDPLCLHRFKLSLFESLIAEQSDSLDSARYDCEMGHLFECYSKQLKLKLGIDNNRKLIAMQLDNLFRLVAICFDQHFQAHIKLIFSEKFCQFEFLQEKYKVERQLKDSESSQNEANNNEMYDEFNQIVIENARLAKRISMLEQRKRLLAQLDQEKVKHFRQIWKDLQFVEMLNHTPNQSSCDESISQLSFSLERIIV